MGRTMMLPLIKRMRQTAKVKFLLGVGGILQRKFDKIRKAIPPQILELFSLPHLQGPFLHPLRTVILKKGDSKHFWGGEASFW